MTHLRKKLVRAAAVVVGLVVAGMVTVANAATVVTFGSTDVATGILDLVVGAGTYNIEFVHGPSTDAYAPGEVVADALNIGNAISAVFNNEGIVRVIDESRQGTGNDNFGIRTKLLLPPDGMNIVVFERSPFTSPLANSWSLHCDYGINDQCNSLGIFSTYVWAVPTLVPIPAIPLPAAFPLFGTGLSILGFLGWRRRRKAAAAV